jgi:hypothetical protein
MSFDSARFFVGTDMGSDMDRAAAEQKAAAEQQRYEAQVAAYANSPVGQRRAAAFQQAQTRIPQLRAETEVLISSVLGKLKARQYRTPPGMTSSPGPEAPKPVMPMMIMPWSPT